MTQYLDILHYIDRIQDRIRWHSAPTWEVLQNDMICSDVQYWLYK